MDDHLQANHADGMQLDTLSESSDSEPSLGAEYDVLKVTARVRSVFRDVWRGYHEWEAAHSPTVIASLAGGPTFKNFNPIESSAHPASSVPPPPSQPKFSDRLETVQEDFDCEITTFDEEGVPRGTETFRGTSVTVQQFTPYAFYESCTPATRSIYAGDDPDDMDFIPYADDPRFPVEAHIEHYRSFSWTHIRGTDLEFVFLETTYRLCYEDGLPPLLIDDTGVLPLSLYVMARVAGGLDSLWLRDYPPWPGFTCANALAAPTKDLTPSSLYSRVVASVHGLCPNLSCLVPHCSTHTYSGMMHPPRVPTGTNKVLAASIRVPCGVACILIADTSQTPSVWSTLEVDNFTTLLDMDPDIAPCDLAVLSRKPCWEVYLQRTLRYPDETIIPPAKLIRRPSKAKTVIRDLGPNDFTPDDPCAHDGPCDAKSKCYCYANRAHCERNCRCSSGCARRWRGCACGSGRTKRACISDRCPCVQAKRECVPGLCRECISTKKCKQNSIQLGLRKGLEVKSSAFGLGAFLTEPVEKGDLISEYIGELIYEDTMISRQDVADYRQRNYMFGLNPTYTIDGSAVGNETRFINHKPRDKTNAECRVLLVNGEHRIGIFSTRKLDKGDEVTINYGEEFFTAELQAAR